MLGKEILGYHVDEKIGSGGFGTVYKVSKTNVSGTYVRALKHITLPTKKQYFSILNSMGGDSTKTDDYFADILKNIVSEIKILSVLSESGNKNIVRYYENDIIENTSPKTYDIYILMEYLTPFTDYLENNTLTVKDVIKLGKDILNALIACHGRNIIHRDIKDDNIFVVSDGTFKIGDFGVSKALKDQSRAASIKGTPNFIAPEVYLGKDNYDHTVDLYSLGIVLYRLLNNLRNPFLPAFPNAYTSEDEDIAFEARMTGKVPELPNMAKNELGEAILKAIKPRNERYNTAKEFLEALENAEKALAPVYLAQGIGLFNVSQLNEETVVFSNADADVTIAIPMSSGEVEEQKSDADSDLFKTIGLFNEDDENVNREEPTQQEQDSNKTIALENDDLADNAQSAESGNTDEEEHAPDKENLGSSFVESQNKTDLVENKQKNKKRFLPLILIAGIVLFVILLVTFIFIGMFRGNTSASVEFKTLNLVGTNAYGSVSNSVTTFSFADEIGAKEIKKYKLCKNADGTQPIVGGVVDLAIGDNYFYLFGSGNNGKKLYTISIRRRPVYNVVLEIDDEQTSYLVEEGSVMLTPNAPEKEGYDFLGWNYDFAVPVSRDLLITPMWGLKEFTVSWRECKNATITVKRISSYNSSATKGTLAVDDVIYYGDVLSVQYTADAGFLLSSKGATSITVSDNVTSSNIYANVKPDSYVATWSTPTGCSITVKRTSSPYALASTGALSNGSAIYYGDVLSVEYAANDGYSITNSGKTRIVVSSNVTSADIYAMVTLNPLSGWVKASELPSDAQVVNRKWSYTKTYYTTSDSSTLSGWTQYNTTSEWSEYGEWSVWQDTEISNSDSCQVEITTVEATAGYYEYRYGRYQNPSNTHWVCCKHFDGYTTSYIKKYTTWSRTHYNSSNEKAGSCSICGKTWYIYKFGSNGTDHYYWEESRYTSPTYKTQYRYRERYLIYTYYFYRTENLEASSCPSGSDISDIQEWVQYRTT